MSKKSDEANTKLIAEAIHDLRREVREQVDKTTTTRWARST